MSDKFLAIPDQLIGAMMFPQEAVDWLAFGPPGQGLRSTLKLDEQVLCVHHATGTLLMAMWGSGLLAYVRSPSLATWYQVPTIYWGRKTPESMQSAMERPVLPDQLPGQPKPLDPRYGIELDIYPHRLPTDDLVGQVVSFRRSEVERYCAIAGPVSQWKLKEPDGTYWSLYEAAAWIATADLTLVEQQREFYDLHPSAKNAGAITWLKLQQEVESRAPDNRLMNLDDARRRLRAACEAGNVTGTGIPVLAGDLYGDRKAIAATEFIGVEIWEGRGGSLHRIVAGQGEAARWLELRFREEDVRKAIGPITSDNATSPSATDRSGAPGRPSSMHLIELEMRGRHERGEMLQVLAQEADALLKWFDRQSDYDELSRPTPKTVKNRLRDIHRDLKQRPEIIAGQ